MNNLICMSFDGEYQREGNFKTVHEAWEHSSNLGSKWYFYPFHFVTTDKMIKDAPAELSFLIGKQIKTVQKMFKLHSQSDDNQDMDCFEFALTL